MVDCPSSSAGSSRGATGGRSILGTVDTVSGFGRDDLHGYMGERYSAPGMVLAAAGGLDHQALVRLAQERFTKLPGQRNNGAPKALFQGGESFVSAVAC